MADKDYIKVISGGLFAQDPDEEEDEDVADETDEESEEGTFDKSSLAPTDYRWAWVEVDTEAINHNIHEFKKRVGARVRMLAVVKADAYGHGAVECAKVAIKAGVAWLAVATVEEGMELREAGIDKPILILAQPPITSIPALLAYNLVPAVYTVEFALALGEQADMQGMVADYHLKVNTGMNRIGVWFEDVAEFLNLISFHRGLNLQGTFTHFATADMAQDWEFRLQLKRFNEALAQVKQAGMDSGIVHAANSAASIRYKESYFDMVRLGISMYGLHPSPVTRGMIELWPAMSIKARITAVNEVPVGEGVGYGLTFTSRGNADIVTIPIGYADGLSRQLSNNMSVIFKNRLYPQVGNICMDQFMVEIDQRSTLLNPAQKVEIGDEVIIIGRSSGLVLHLDAMADALGTINYELACRFGMRMPKVYV